MHLQMNYVCYASTRELYYNDSTQPNAVPICLAPPFPRELAPQPTLQTVHI